MLDDLDAGFASIEAPAAEGARPPSDAAFNAMDMETARELFVGLAAGYARPLRDFLLSLRWGDATKTWLDVCAACTRGLRRSAAAMEMPELADALDQLGAAFELAAGPEPSITKDAEELITTAYAKLASLFPAVFALDEEQERREPVIVDALLRRVPEVKKVALDKIYAAGLTRLDMMYAAKAGDIADATGLPIDVTEKIVAVFAQYRSEATSINADEAHTAERRKLAELLTELKEHHAAYEAAARSWAPGAARDRSRRRQERDEVVLQINVAWARIGEVDRVRAFEKLPFSQKIETLERWLAEAQKSAAPK